MWNNDVLNVTLLTLLPFFPLATNVPRAEHSSLQARAEEPEKDAKYFFHSFLLKNGQHIECETYTKTPCGYHLKGCAWETDELKCAQVARYEGLVDID